MLALVAAHRLGRLQRPDAVEAEPPENAADGGRRDAHFGGDLLAGPALTAQPLNLRHCLRRRRLAKPAGSRRAVLQTFRALCLVARDPLAHRADRHAERLANRLNRLPLHQHPPNQIGSTMHRQAGILVNVHPVPPRTLKLRNLSFPGPNRMDNLLKAHT